jgi:1-acyl-sn-glycerol-3-phosphate acyltransferase
VVLFTLPCYLAAILGSLALSPWPRQRARWRGGVFQLFSRLLCLALAVKVRRVGPPPRPPFLLVSNHLSYLDVIVLGSQLPCVFVAKAEIDGWPAFGAMCRSVETIFIDRKARRALHTVLERIDRTLAAGQAIVIFPEGTSGAGDRVMPFRSPLLELPVKLGRSVHWAALGYRVKHDAAPVHLAVNWWGEMPLGPHLWALAQLPGIEAQVVLGDEPVAESDRKRLSEALHRRVAAAFAPMATVDSAEVARLNTLKEIDPSALPAILRPSSESS